MMRLSVALWATNPALCLTGALDGIPPPANASGDGPMPVARDLPVDTARWMRAGGAGVWPGARSASRLSIDDPRQDKIRT